MTSIDEANSYFQIITQPLDKSIFNQMPNTYGSKILRHDVRGLSCFFAENLFNYKNY